MKFVYEKEYRIHIPTFNVVYLLKNVLVLVFSIIISISLLYSRFIFHFLYWIICVHSNEMNLRIYVLR